MRITYCTGTVSLALLNDNGGCDAVSWYNSTQFGGGGTSRVLIDGFAVPTFLIKN